MGCRGIDVVAKKRRQSLQRCRAPVTDPVAIALIGVIEEPGTEPESDTECCRREPLRLSRVVRRGLRVAADRPGRTDFTTLRHAGGGIRPVLEQGDQIGTIRARHHVERGEVQVLLHRSGDARLVRTEKLIHRIGGVVRRGGSLAAGKTGGGPDSEPRDSGAERRTEQPSVTQARGGRDVLALARLRTVHALVQESTVPVSCERGSARALSRSLSARLSSSARSRYEINPSVSEPCSARAAPSAA